MINENRLEHLEEFTEHLSHMQLSESAEQILAETSLVLLVGPTSAGRNTIIQELLKTGFYHNIISDTTRHKRTRDGLPIEEHGREYWFRSEDEVLADIKRGEFLEAAVIHQQQVSGISIREIKQAHQAGQIAITDVEPSGAGTIHIRKPDTILIFVVPPAFDKWMERLRSRSDVPEAEVRRRLETACAEFETVLQSHYYTFILNDVLSQAVTDVDEVVRLGKTDAVKESHAREAAKQLLDDVRAYLHQG